MSRPAQKLVTSLKEESFNKEEKKVARKALPQVWIEKMKSLPETGMGFHKVKVLLKDGTVIQGLVFNSEILETNLSFNSDEIVDISPG